MFARQWLTSEHSELSSLIFDPYTTVDWIVISTDCFYSCIIPWWAIISHAFENFTSIGIGVECCCILDVSIITNDDFFADFIVHGYRSNCPFDFHRFPTGIETDLLTRPFVENYQGRLNYLSFETGSTRENIDEYREKISQEYLHISWCAHWLRIFWNWTKYISTRGLKLRFSIISRKT